MDLSQPNFFDPKVLNEVANKVLSENPLMSRELMMSEVDIINQTSGSTVLAHEEANVRGVGEVATILFVEHAMSAAEGVPRRTSRNGVPLQSLPNRDQVTPADIKNLYRIGLE